ncbi:MAG: hypothetical protein UIM53_02980 [Acutalibacteraceae bacterium]|nr:hypothetical protein [Acutalibacteraceae bacterium]
MNNFFRNHKKDIIRPSPDKTNAELNIIIETFIDSWQGTSIGSDIRNMYENGTSYEAICERLGLEYSYYDN